MSTTDCGGLHIRTPKTDNILVPNIITQSIVTNGMRIGIIPETNVVGEFLYSVIIKNSGNNIIFQNPTAIVYTGYGKYLYVVIPFASLPNVGEVINIKITSSLGCIATTDYNVLSYTASTDNTTTVNSNGIISKYLKLKPTITSNGFFKDSFYYFKCNTNTDTDDECFIQFKQNTDLTKVLSALPINTEVVSCPESYDWLYINTVCVSNAVTTIPSTTLIACTTGLTLNSIVFSSGTTYKITFTGDSITSIIWKLFDSSNIQVKTGNSGILSMANFSADFGTIPDDTYTLTIVATNCSSSLTSGTKTFIKGTVANVPTLYPSEPFINVLKSVVVETINSQYNPDAFPTIVVVNSPDPVLANKLFPNWSISWKVEGTNFRRSTTNKTTPNLGIPFMFDLQFKPYGGYGTRCVDYVLPQDPSNNNIWLSDTACVGAEFNQYFNNQEHTIANFSSALPFHERAGDGGGAGHDKEDEWAGKVDANGNPDLAFFFDEGKIGSERFGFRDWVNGKANIALADYDNEGTFDTDKSIAILLGLSSKSLGYVFDQYSNIMQGVYLDPSQYPNNFNDPNSAFPIHTQLIDGTDGEPNSGNNGIVINNVPTRQTWNPTRKISIPSKSIVNKGASDFLNILPCCEVSCLSSATLKQGESYLYHTTPAVPATNTKAYIPPIPLYRTVNKFGTKANTEHMIARTIFASEIHKWYCVNRLDNRKMIVQAKILCDAGKNGLLFDESSVNKFITNIAMYNLHFNRKHSFMIGAFVAFSGCEWNIWDRNSVDVNLDGYHGAFGIINLLNQRRKFGQIRVTGEDEKSFVDLKLTAKFLLWTSEIAYGGSSTFVQNKATEYALDSSNIPQRQFITPDGYWGGFLARPEGTEATSCVLRVSYKGTFFYYRVTSDMWETTNYAQKDTPLAQLVNDDKHYHYFLIKLGSGVATTTITSTTTVVPPQLIPINVFVLAGESNAGTRNNFETLATGEGGFRDGVRIWNNSTGVLEKLNVGVNNYYGETARVEFGWGMEAELANLRKSNVITKDFIVVKTAQGGAMIGNYNSDITDTNPNYFDSMTARINGVKLALNNEGKTPIFYILYSQGINNANAQNVYDDAHFNGLRGITYWESATKLYLYKLRLLMGTTTKICLMKFFEPYGTYLNGAITNIVNNNSYNSFIVTDGLSLQTDNLHFDAPATRTIADRYITAFGLTTPVTPDPVPTTPIQISPVIVNGNNIFYLMNCATKVLTISGKFIASTQIGVALKTSAGVVKESKDNIPNGNFSVTFTGVDSGSYMIRIYQIGVDDNSINTSVFNINCSITTVVDSTTAIPQPPTGTTEAPIGANGFSIKVPDKPAYYFSNNNPPSYYDDKSKLPAIHDSLTHSGLVRPTMLLSGLPMQARYNPIDDLVWIKNDYIKIGINLKRGGQIAWASLINDTTNLVYNGFDGGFQITLDAYQKRDGFNINGKFSRTAYSEYYQTVNTPRQDPNTKVINPNIPDLSSYNTTMGGDFLNHSQSLIDYHPVTNGYYVKFRPIFYTINSEFSETYIEVTYTLDGYAVKCDYKYTSFRQDDQFTGSGFDSGHAPACFLINSLTKYKSYTGDQAWTRSNRYDVEDNWLPNEEINQPKTGQPITKQSKERWALVYNPNDSKTIGVYANSNDDSTGFNMKQKEVFQENGNNPDNYGNEFSGGYTFFGRNFDILALINPTEDRSNFSKSVSSYLIVTPNTNTFIDTVYRVSGH